MDPQDSVLDILSKEPFVCLKRIDNISPKSSLNYVKDAKKEPIVILEDIGNDKFGLPSSVREKKNQLNDFNGTKSLFMKKIGNIEKQENHERIMKIGSQQDESLSEKVKLTIDNNDMIPTLRKEFCPLITDSNISNFEKSSKTHVNLDTEDLLKNVRKNVDYDAAITNQNNNFDSLTLKKLCLKFKATIHIVRLSQNMRKNTCFSGKSYIKNVCTLDHKKFKRCLFNTNVCNADVLKEEPLTDYESSDHKLEDADTVSNEKREISVSKYAKTHGAMVSDFNTGHSNSQNYIKNVFSPISVGCKRPIIDKIPTVDLKKLGLDFEKTNCDEKESNRITKEISTKKHVAPLAVLFSDCKTVPSMLDNDLKSRFTHRSVAWKQPCTNKIYTNDRKRVGFNDEKLNFNMNYGLKESNRIKPFKDKVPTVVLKRLKINTTESTKIKQEISNVNHAKINGNLVSDTKTVHCKLQDDFKNRIPNIFVPCKQPFIRKIPAVNLKKLGFDDETINSDEGSKVLRNSSQINSHLIKPKPNKTDLKTQGGKEKYCKEFRIVVKRLRGDIIKKHLSMLSYPRNNNNYGNMHMQKSSNSQQRRNSKFQCYSPTKNSLMFSILQYSIDHTDILSKFKNKSCKKNQNSSILWKKKNLGRNGSDLHVAFKVFCTLQLSYSIHKVNALHTRF